MRAIALICAALCMSILTLACAARHYSLSDMAFPYKYSGNINKAGLNEPSGIAYHPKRETLFAVGDEGDICEMTTEGDLINMRHLRDDDEGDFEGITVHPNTGLLYVVVEGKDTILEIEPEGLNVIREFPIDRVYAGRMLIAPGGQGIEGITFLPDATGETFLITNQCFDLEDEEDPSIIMKVRLPLDSRGADNLKGMIVDYFNPGIIDISDIYYNSRSNTITAISDAQNIIFKMDGDGRLINARALSGKDQEGIAVDAMGNIYIAQDSGEIIKYSKKGF